MPASTGAALSPNRHAACSGCSLCLLVCPVWRATRNPRLTPEGRAKALQHGATAAELRESIVSCTLCGACEPVCPEDIGLVAMVLDLRAQALTGKAAWREIAGEMRARMLESGNREISAPGTAAKGVSRVLLAGMSLRARPATLARACSQLACVAAGDDGADIALAIETGLAIPDARRERFLAPLKGCGSVVVADGLLLRQLRVWLPQANLASLGEALSGDAAVRHRLRASDLYVIEPRAYHADYPRLVKMYDRLRADTGCVFNLDLQRIAIPATAKSLMERLGLAVAADRGDAQWIMKGRRVERIVVESAEDIAAFSAVTELPVVHLADLADD